MKASIKHQNSDIPKKDYKLFEDFIKFLNKEYPLKHQIEIIFTGERIGGMTTGSRTTEHTLKVLSKGRLNRDIMRTLAHEWVHEYQHGVLNREKGPDIGGRNEDEANAFAGRLIKMFEKSYPQYDKEIFEGFKSIVNKLDVISEQIVLSEKENIQQKFLTEMKEIGIDKLPYSYSAIKRFVDPETMDIHYNKHYKGYVKKLNDALSKKKGEMSLEDIVKSISKFDTKVRNNAGGAFNHALFWKMLSPKKQKPNGEVYDKIVKQYGSFDKFKEEFNKVALDRFGSGWVWLILTKTNRLKVMSTPNQDNPLMNVVDGGGYPLLGLDVWEHAYYLRYRNKRDQYINKFWDCVNWDFVNDLFELKTNKKESITESVDNKKPLTEAKQLFPLTPKVFKNLINNSYPECNVGKYRSGCVGVIETKKCTTERGVIGGNFSEKKYGGNGNWSIINRFDTNSIVHKEIENIWVEETDGLEDFRTWIIKNMIELVGNNGKYTKRLVDINKETILSGRENESYAKTVVIKTFKLNPKEEGISWNIFERCAGDIRDRKLGQDFDVLIDGTSYFVQVKPVEYKSIKKIGSERGYYYKVPSWHNHNKYQESNVDIILYVDRHKDKFIMFRNDFSRIQTVANPTTFPKFFVYYYENPIHTNMEFETHLEPEKVGIKPKLVRNKESEIDYYKERIQYYQELIDKLGGNQKLTERVHSLGKRLSNLLSVDNKIKFALKWLNREFSNLTKVVTVDEIHYVDKNRNPIFSYDPDQKLYEDIGYIYVNYDRIWEFLISSFNMNNSQAEEILTIWLEETYGIRGFVPFSSDNRINIPLEESITENKKESLQDKLKNIVKNVGPKQASDIVGGPENLLKLAFNNDLMEFLHLFNNLDIVQSEEQPSWTLFRYKKGENLMIYDREHDAVHISYIIFWNFLQNFNSQNEIKSLIKRWLSEIYDLNGITFVSIGIGMNLSWMGSII
jgi:Fe-Mn family superoxide dismutase